MLESAHIRYRPSPGTYGTGFGVDMPMTPFWVPGWGPKVAPWRIFVIFTAEKTRFFALTDPTIIQSRWKQIRKPATPHWMSLLAQTTCRIRESRFHPWPWAQSDCITEGFRHGATSARWLGRLKLIASQVVCRISPVGICRWSVCNIGSLRHQKIDLIDAGEVTQLKTGFYDFGGSPIGPVQHPRWVPRNWARVMSIGFSVP